MSTLCSVKSGYANVSMFAWPTGYKLTGQSPEWIHLRNESKQSLSQPVPLDKNDIICKELPFD